MKPEIWAPRAQRLEVVRDDGSVSPMLCDERSGRWTSSVSLGHGDRYRLRVDGFDAPDPGSSWQPDGVDGWSAAVDHTRYPWTDHHWRGFHLPGAVLYELHIGTFTPEGTFDAAIAKLDHLVGLGVDAIELMPVAEFAGDRGWGYDGVLLFAPHHAYGGPDGLKRLVDAAHGRGLGVLLDVVYNHLGPSGNHLARFGPYQRGDTPWGETFDFGKPEVRRFVIDNAVHWVRHFHLDGLRLDAVHALVDESPVSIVVELTDAVRTAAARDRRARWVIAENEPRDPTIVTAREAGGDGLDAVWADDLHHTLHVLFTGEQQGYYDSYDGSLAELAQALTEVHVVPERPVGELARWRFVVCNQNHDQVGNRAAGERLITLAGRSAAKIAAAISILSPATPLLFQGEEWGATTPFAYFAGFDDPDLAAAVRDGRRAEFAGFGWNEDAVLDPIDRATFESSVLRWEESDPAMVAWYRALIAARREAGRLISVQYDELARWLVIDRGTVSLVVNFAEHELAVSTDADAPSALIAHSEPGAVLDAEGLRVPARSAAVVLSTSARG